MSSLSYFGSRPAPITATRSGWASSSRIFFVSLSGWKVVSEHFLAAFSRFCLAKLTLRLMSSSSFAMTRA